MTCVRVSEDEERGLTRAALSEMTGVQVGSIERDELGERQYLKTQASFVSIGVVIDLAPVDLGVFTDELASATEIAAGFLRLGVAVPEDIARAASHLARKR